MQLKKKVFCALAAVSLLGLQAKAQKVEFTEYDLPNGLHVVLHQDSKAPVVAITVMYHVGSKNEVAGRTGFAHFFEHLLFEGSDNIKRGEFMKIVSANGGQNNANTTQDRTFYFEVFPSNQLETGMWLESERMMHPVINEIGVTRQKEVVKEEKRQSHDNRPYGNFSDAIAKDLFPNHPYHNGIIGQMNDIDAAKLDEFKAFFKQYYGPNNAVLTIAGDINIDKTKELVKAYFGDIPRGADVVYKKIEEAPITKQIVDTTYDANIQIPLIVSAYRVPGRDSRDSKIMQMISSILTGGSSARMNKKMVDEKKDALQVLAINYALEDYGMYIIGALPNNGAAPSALLSDMDEEITKLQTDLISPEDYQKLQNQFENNFVSANTRMQGVAESLSNGYTFYHKDTGHINKELTEIKSITREEIRDAAKKYLNANQRLVLYYLPEKGKAQ
ncbi:insulinase family protein [Mucilaginibacter sp. BJC16-A38]|uniref:M16 family metallopeptidase n=1 Tax=Mucilaginibacter phenanthrenivorans TaxID=1234842 RepID=UPI00215706A9|nr:pitrilysin family protein [Mucilaginibacter phenanthrenivorans]MCR8561767.1 insulinase family protein [Mucilaginibacter phenanthrenivorans]